MLLIRLNVIIFQNMCNLMHQIQNSYRNYAGKVQTALLDNHPKHKITAISLFFSFFFSLSVFKIQSFRTYIGYMQPMNFYNISAFQHVNFSHCAQLLN